MSDDIVSNIQRSHRKFIREHSRAPNAILMSPIEFDSLVMNLGSPSFQVPHTFQLDTVLGMRIYIVPESKNYKVGILV